MLLSKEEKLEVIDTIINRITDKEIDHYFICDAINAHNIEFTSFPELFILIRYGFHMYSYSKSINGFIFYCENPINDRVQLLNEFKELVKELQPTETINHYLELIPKVLHKDIERYRDIANPSIVFPKGCLIS